MRFWVFDPSESKSTPKYVSATTSSGKNKSDDHLQSSSLSVSNYIAKEDDEEIESIETCGSAVNYKKFDDKSIYLQSNHISHVCGWEDEGSCDTSSSSVASCEFDVLQMLRCGLENLPSMVAGVWSNDYKLQLQGIVLFRELLSIDQSPPVEEVIQTGVVPRFVEFLARDDFPRLQFEAAWVLTNIACGTIESTWVVIDHGAVPILVRLLASPYADIVEQALWALGNVASDAPKSRDLVLSHGVLLLLRAVLNEHVKLSILRIATWTLSNLCRGKPQPPFEQVRSILPALGRLMNSDDDEVLTYACEALSFLSNGEVQAVIEAGVCPRLVELLNHPMRSVLVPALRTVGNIVQADDIQTQSVISYGALPFLLSLMTHNHEKSIKKEACWTISNITARNKEEIQAVIEAGLIVCLMNLLDNAEFDIKKQAIWAIANATYGSTNEQIEYLVSQGCIKPLCDLLICHDPMIVYVCLGGLTNILKVGEAEKNLRNSGDINKYAQMIDDEGGVEKLESLQSHENTEISQEATMVLRTIIIH